MRTRQRYNQLTKDSLTQWDDAAQWYDQNMGETGDALNATIIRPTVLEMLGDLTDTCILDVGCGSGYLAAELAAHAMTVTGTDFAPSFISLCQQKYKGQDNLKFVIQNVEEPFQFADTSFDVVVCKMVLQYVQDIRPFAGEAMRMLKPGGKLLILVDHPFRAVYFNGQQQDGSANNPNNCFSDEPKTKLSLWGKTKLTWYARTTSSYVQLFIESGFKLVEIREPLAVPDSPIPFSVLALKFIK